MKRNQLIRSVLLAWVISLTPFYGSAAPIDYELVDIYGENINKIKVSSLSENFFDRHFAEIKQFKLINFSCN